MTLIAILAGVVVVTIAVFPGVRRARNPRETRWLDSGLKAVVIVVLVTLLTVLVPAEVMAHEKVADLDRTAQDLVGAGTWTLGFALVLVLLRSAQRRDLV